MADKKVNEFMANHHMPIALVAIVAIIAVVVMVVVSQADNSNLAGNAPRCLAAPMGGTYDCAGSSCNDVLMQCGDTLYLMHYVDGSCSNVYVERGDFGQTYDC